MKPILITFALTLSALAQGPLTPPGAPAPTMKTLDQIEPRIPVQSLAAAPPYVITQPGSCYLNANITSPNGQDGIRIESVNVTLDLNGFTLIGIGPTSGGTAISATRRAAIKNGFIQGAGVTGSGSYTASGYEYGVDMIDGGSVTDLIVDGCEAGISIGGSVNRCRVTNADDGIDATEVTESVALNCYSSGIFAERSCRDSTGSAAFSGIHSFGSVERCYGASSRDDGITAYNVSHSQGIGTSNGIDASENVNDSTGTVFQSAFSGPYLYGIRATGTVSNSKGTCTATSGTYTQMFGIRCDSAVNCTATSSGNGIRAFANVTNSYGKADNGGKGIWVDGTASFCRGDHTSSSGTAIQAAIAVACTSANGTITGNKQLGTP